MKKLIVLTPYPDKSCMDWACHNDDIIMVKTWDEVMNILEADYPAKAKTAVVQDATMQYIIPQSE